MRSPLLLLAAAIVASAGCGDSTPQSLLADKIGKNCVVRLRRGDALGAAADLPIGPETDSINGARTSVTGKLISEGGGWLTIVGDQGEMYIPRESVLLIQFERASQPTN